MILHIRERRKALYLLLGCTMATPLMAADEDIPSLEFLSFVGEFTDESGEPIDIELLQDGNMINETAIKGNKKTTSSLQNDASLQTGKVKDFKEDDGNE